MWGGKCMYLYIKYMYSVGYEHAPVTLGLCRVPKRGYRTFDYLRTVFASTSYLLGAWKCLATRLLPAFSQSRSLGPTVTRLIKLTSWHLVLG